MPLFNPRQERAPAPAAPPPPVHQSASLLTRTHHYTAAKLFDVEADGAFRAVVDRHTQHAVVLTPTAIQVFRYTPALRSSVAFFPTAELLLATTVAPAAGARDPGVVIVSPSGTVDFYELVAAAPALGLINDAGVRVQLLLAADETAVLVENCEPAGVCVGTSRGRVLLVLLRDAHGRVLLQVLEIIAPRRLLASWLARLISGHDSRVVALSAVTPIKRTGPGSTEVAILDTAGTLTLAQCSRNSVHTVSSLVAAQCLRAVDGFRPGGDARFVGRGVQVGTNGELLVLSQVTLEGDASVSDVFVHTVETRDGALVTGTLRVGGCARGITPTFVVPAPKTTAYVLLWPEVCMIDLQSGPRWKDLLRFDASVGAAGFGEENGSAIVITSAGAYRVARTDDTSVPSVELHAEERIHQALAYPSELLEYLPVEGTEGAIIKVAQAPSTLLLEQQLVQLEFLAAYTQQYLRDPATLSAVVERISRVQVCLGARPHFEAAPETIGELVVAYATHPDSAQGLASCLYTGIVDVHRKYGVLPRGWVFAHPVAFAVDGVFALYARDTPAGKVLAELAEVLFCLLDSAVEVLASEDTEAYAEYLAYYHKRRPFWTQTLADKGEAKAAVRLAEEYGDWQLLARLIEHMDDAVVSALVSQHGEALAVAVYDRWRTTGQLKRLLTAMPEQRQWLLEYLERPECVGIAWVRHGLDEEWKQVYEGTGRAVASGDQRVLHVKLQLSVGKLAGLVDGSDVLEVTRSLLLVSAQAELVNVDLGEVKASCPATETVVRQSLPRWESGRVLPHTAVVDLLTLTAGSMHQRAEYFKRALELAAGNERRVVIQRLVCADAEVLRTGRGVSLVQLVGAVDPQEAEACDVGVSGFRERYPDVSEEVVESIAEEWLVLTQALGEGLGEKVASAMQRV